MTRHTVRTPKEKVGTSSGDRCTAEKRLIFLHGEGVVSETDYNSIFIEFRYSCLTGSVEDPNKFRTSSSSGESKIHLKCTTSNLTSEPSDSVKDLPV